MADTSISDEEYLGYLDLAEQTEQGVKRGRIPLAEAMEFHRALRAKYPVVPNLVEFDFDTRAFSPHGWRSYEEDQIEGRLTGTRVLDLNKIELCLDPGQQDSNTIIGYELKERLAGQSVIPAHVLDFYLKNPHLIPDSWKGELIFFWGTIYRLSDGNLYVRCLYWNDGQWSWDYYWLDSQWDGQRWPAVLAS